MYVIIGAARSHHWARTLHLLFDMFVLSGVLRIVVLTCCCVWGLSRPRQEFCHVFHYSCFNMARFSKVQRKRAIGMTIMGMKISQDATHFQAYSSKILPLLEYLAYTERLTPFKVILTWCDPRDP